MANINLQNIDLGFTKNTVYKDVRILGGSAFRDIKMSLSLGTSSDIIYYLKKYSKLLNGCTGSEKVTSIYRGIFTQVFLLEDCDGKELVIKKSHDGWIPFQLIRNLYVSLPQVIARVLFPDYGVTAISLRRDVYDYEKIIRPFWGSSRSPITSKIFTPYLNMALHFVTNFLPLFSKKDLYRKEFWEKLLTQKQHKDLPKLQKYINSVKTQELLVPEEERYIFYDAFSNSLQTIFVQEAIRGQKDVICDKKMAFPFELVAEGVIEREMPKLMLEHILRTIESFVTQLDYKDEIPKVPDFRPLFQWKVFPPTPYEFYFAETNNLVVCRSNKGDLKVVLVDTHLLMEPENNFAYRWFEKRYWMSLFLNLRFWIRKALDFVR